MEIEIKIGMYNTLSRCLGLCKATQSNTLNMEKLYLKLREQIFYMLPANTVLFFDIKQEELVIDGVPVLITYNILSLKGE